MAEKKRKPTKYTPPESRKDYSWMELTKGGTRKSAYSANTKPTPPNPTKDLSVRGALNSMGKAAAKKRRAIKKQEK
jgi:hypothetical protein